MSRVYFMWLRQYSIISFIMLLTMVWLSQCLISSLWLLLAGGADPSRLRRQRRMGNLSSIRRSRSGYTRRIIATSKSLGPELPTRDERIGLFHGPRAARLRVSCSPELQRSDEVSASGVFQYAYGMLCWVRCECKQLCWRIWPIIPYSRLEEYLSTGAVLRLGVPRKYWKK